MNELKYETIWFDQRKYEEAESRYYKIQKASSPSSVREDPQRSSIVDQIAKARETIQQTLKGECPQSGESLDPNSMKRLSLLEKENEQLKEVVKSIQASLNLLESRVAKIEHSKGDQISNAQNETKPNTKPQSEDKGKVDDDDDDDDDDDEDLFGSDNDEEAERLREIRLAQYAAKKAKKPAVVAKSNIILDVKPWGDETDMAELEEKVRSISCDGLLWGASKLVAVGYGIKKLQISCVVEDDKVGTDYLEEKITAFEDHVQSMDVVAFNKV